MVTTKLSPPGPLSLEKGEGEYVLGVYSILLFPSLFKGGLKLAFIKQQLSTFLNGY